MDEKIIEEYKTLEEATNRARELNGVIKLDSGLSAGTYDYCVKYIGIMVNVLTLL